MNDKIKLFQFFANDINSNDSAISLLVQDRTFMEALRTIETEIEGMKFYGLQTKRIIQEMVEHMISEETDVCPGHPDNESFECFIQELVFNNNGVATPAQK